MASADVLKFIPPALHAAILTGMSRVDVTRYLVSAVASGQPFKIGAGTYCVGHWIIDRAANIETDGDKTVFRQLAGIDPTKPGIEIAASHVTFGACRLVGNIATDKLEFRHGIQISSKQRPVSDVKIGDLSGEDIRGDVFNVTAWLPNAVTDVAFGAVSGSNILRNVVSIVGGREIRGGWITGRAVGYALFDIEPEDFTTPADDIEIKGVVGGRVQIAGTTKVCAVGRASIGYLEVAPRLQANSRPAYAGYDVSVGLTLRNVSDAAIGIFKADDCKAGAVKHVFDRGDLTDQKLTIQSVNFSNLGSDAIAAGRLSRVTVDGGRVTGLGAGKAFIQGDAAQPRRSNFVIRNLMADGLLAKDAALSRFEDCDVTNLDGYAFGRVSDSLIVGGRFKVLGLGYDCSNNRLMEVDARTGGKPWVSLSANPLHLLNGAIRSLVRGF